MANIDGEILSIQWPIKILLAHPQAPFLQQDKFTIAADCVAFSSDNFGKRPRKDEGVVIGCPLLEDPDKMMSKLALMIRETSAGNIDVYTMEVPCCHAVHMMVERAINEAGKGDISKNNYIVRVSSGEIEPYRPGVIDDSMIDKEKKVHGHGPENHHKC